MTNLPFEPPPTGADNPAPEERYQMLPPAPLNTVGAPPVVDAVEVKTTGNSKVRKIVIIVGAILILCTMVLASLAIFVFSGILTSATSNSQSDGSRTAIADGSEVPLDYSYGETSPAETMFGIDASGLRTTMGYAPSTSPILFESETAECQILVQYGYAPEEAVNTGDDKQATLTLLEGYLGEDEENAVITDHEFKYFASDGAEAGAAPVKYAEVEAVADDGSTRFVGVHARVISMGGGTATTILTSCASEELLHSTVDDIEDTVYFWPAEAVY